jgi:PhnB protein
MSQSTNDYPLLSPALAVRDAAKAIEFYKAAFGAVERFRLVDPGSGKIGHAELTINGCLVMLADEYPAFNKAPQTLDGTTVKLSLMVPDVDTFVEQAKRSGATVLMPPQDQFYGHRSASIQDPFGHQWLIQHEIERVSPAEMQRRWDAMMKK